MKPSYNHTREDGPFDPCDECLSLMSREDLLAYVRDLRDQDVVPVFGSRECEAPGCGKDNGHEGECGPWTALLEAAQNVVAQWRGDISRKPHIGRLRDAIAEVVKESNAGGEKR